VDPVTGLSRRQLIALGVLIPLGIVASTIATFVGEVVRAPCPEDRFVCAVFQPGEPIEVGLIAAAEGDDERAVLEAMERDLEREPPLLGHSIEADLRRTGCSPEAASQAGRELGSDPPDEPPSALVITYACETAIVPVAQLLSDMGTPIVVLGAPPPPIPTEPELDLAAQGFDPSDPGALVADVLGAIRRVMVQDGERLLVPGRGLLDELIALGFTPIP
jgi:hypothetical protein